MEPTPPATLTAAPSFIPPALHRGTRARTREAQQGAYFDRSGLLFLQLTFCPAAHYKPLTGQIKGDPQAAALNASRALYTRDLRSAAGTQDAAARDPGRRAAGATK